MSIDSGHLQNIVMNYVKEHSITDVLAGNMHHIEFKVAGTSKNAALNASAILLY